MRFEEKQFWSHYLYGQPVALSNSSEPPAMSGGNMEPLGSDIWSRRRSEHWRAGFMDLEALFLEECVVRGIRLDQHDQSLCLPDTGSNEHSIHQNRRDSPTSSGLSHSDEFNHWRGFVESSCMIKEAVLGKHRALFDSPSKEDRTYQFVIVESSEHLRYASLHELSEPFGLCKSGRIRDRFVEAGRSFFIVGVSGNSSHSDTYLSTVVAKLTDAWQSAVSQSEKGR